MFNNPADIVRFWQAVEIFSPQSLPQRNVKKKIWDYQRGESRPMPWEPGSRLDPPKDGYVWRHEIFGGLYELSRVRDVLVASFGDDNPEAPPVKGGSALFACIVDGHGLLLEGSQVVSACAWACGQLARGRSPLAGSGSQTRKHADELGKLTQPGVATGLRLLAVAIREAIPDAVSGGVGAIVASALAMLGGPVAAAGGAVAGGIAGRAAKSAVGAANGQPGGTAPRTLAAATADFLTGDDLSRFTAALAEELGVVDVLRPLGIRVRSYQIPVDRVEEEQDTSFLNSFITEDLANVESQLRQGNAGRALTRYLTPARYIDVRRTDVQHDPLAVRDGVAPQNTPAGRWVTNTNRSLAFSQQFAVNQAIAELGGNAGLFAVNGPPGTGKTTMLRDLIAAIIVNRAIELAEMERPDAAFHRLPHRWERESYTGKIWTPDPRLTGSEIVVASSNNGAVENVTTEIPGAKGIGEDFQAAATTLNYFTETAVAVHGEKAWAMVAARLGNRGNRDRFADRFWFKSMRHILNDPQPSDWQTSVAAFRSARARVIKLAAERELAAHSVSLFPSVEADLEAARVRVSGASNWLGTGLARRRLNSLESEYQRLQFNVEDAVRRWGRSQVPAGAEFTETQHRELIERREKSTPWGDEDFARARTDLFLSALALHKALVLGAVREFRDNLNALTDILLGKGLPSDPRATQAAWRTFFLVVPVVSSTFASFDKLFAGLGRECLGWLLIDEAGQAAPQNAVGALWRSRRAVIVGDPLQLEPVVTLPWAGQDALRRQFAVSPEWAPSRTSVQQIADRHARHGTLLPSAASGDRIWVGTPLRVHRRCDRPMFDISNKIAYDGLMVYGTSERDPFPRADGWIDIKSADAEGHWIPAEGAALRTLLTDLRDDDIPVESIRVLSPFRIVADEARKVHQDLFPHVKPDDRESWVGTVHTMQGKEADVVVLVLGGDPRKPRARSFATGRPNLLNVAVSRARRRLYVIGNRKAWGDDGCFTILADRLPVIPLPESPEQMSTTPETLAPSASTGLVWRTKSGSVFHATRECEWLQRGLDKARRNGRQPSEPAKIPLQEAPADGLPGCRSCCPPWTRAQLRKPKGQLLARIDDGQERADANRVWKKTVQELRPRPFPDDTASLLPGLLAATRAGLPPASDDELTNAKKHHGTTSRCHLPFCWAHE